MTEIEKGRRNLTAERVLFNIQCASIEEVSVINAEGPPVPIPNTEVKLCSGENTLRETVREDSSMLTQFSETCSPRTAN